MSAKADVWWQLAWSYVRSHPGQYRGAVTHAMTDDGTFACGRTMLAPETGAASDDEESTEPSCRQCRRKLGMDLTPAGPDAQQADSAGGVASGQREGDRSMGASVSATTEALTPLQARIVSC